MVRKSPLKSRRSRSARRLGIAALSLSALLGLLPLSAAPQPLQELGSTALAQSGGGFGGSTRGGSSRSNSSGGFSGGGYSGGGGFYPVPVGGPIIIGSGGFGGGLFGLIIFGIVIAQVLSSMRRAQGLAGNMEDGGSAQAVLVQVALTGGDRVKADLQDVARRGNPGDDDGLARMIQEAALVLLRRRSDWTYGRVETVAAGESRAASQVGAWATEARSAIQVQTTSHYQDSSSRSAFEHRDDYTFEKGIGDLYLVVTIAVASRAFPTLGQTQQPSASEIANVLQAISGVNGLTLIRGEVVWSPDEEGEFLNEDQTIMKYGQLSKI